MNANTQLIVSAPAFSRFCEWFLEQPEPVPAPDNPQIAYIPGSGLYVGGKNFASHMRVFLDDLCQKCEVCEAYNLNEYVRYDCTDEETGEDNFHSGGVYVCQDCEAAKAAELDEYLRTHPEP